MKYTHTHIQTHTCAHTHTYTNSHTHTHTHTHTQTLCQCRIVKDLSTCLNLGARNVIQHGMIFELTDASTRGLVTKVLILLKHKIHTLTPPHIRKKIYIYRHNKRWNSSMLIENGFRWIREKIHIQNKTVMVRWHSDNEVLHYVSATTPYRGPDRNSRQVNYVRQASLSVKCKIITINSRNPFVCVFVCVCSLSPPRLLDGFRSYLGRW